MRERCRMVFVNSRWVHDLLATRGVVTENAWPRSERIYSRSFRSDSYSPWIEKTTLRFDQIASTTCKTPRIEWEIKTGIRTDYRNACRGQVGDCWSEYPPGVNVLHNCAGNEINLDKEIPGWKRAFTKSVDRHISVMVGRLGFDITVVYAVAINWSL